MLRQIKQKHAKSQVKKSEDLVRAYLLCIDEIAALQKLYTRKLDFFGGLEQDIIAHEEKDIAAGRPQYNPQGEQPLERVKWAKHLVQEDLTEIRRLNDEMQAALKTVSFEAPLVNKVNSDAYFPIALPHAF